MGSTRTESAAETEAVGARLAERLRPGQVVLVAGELGTGKTTLIRGACRALGIAEPVTSPTFTIGHRYRGRQPVAHLDLFRLADAVGEEPGLLEDYLGTDEVTFVEWPGEALAELAGVPGGEARIAARVEIRHAGGDRREVTVSW